MAEAEDIVTDVARHATIYARDLWRRHRSPPEFPRSIALIDVAARIDLFISSIFGESYPIRTAQLPARPTVLALTFKKVQTPFLKHAIPATDDRHIWLPPDSETTDADIARERYRVMALQQVTRARRGAATAFAHIHQPLIADVYLLLEAYAADDALAASLPGITDSINRLRKQVLTQRPPLSAFPQRRQVLEVFLRNLLESRCGNRRERAAPISASPQQSLENAHTIVAQWNLDAGKSTASAMAKNPMGTQPLLKNFWTGELRIASARHETSPGDAMESPPSDDSDNPRSARLQRRPEEREAIEGEDDEQEPGVWMVQADESHPHAEDPMGMQRPADRDDEDNAAEKADLVSELAQARLVSTPGKPKEVLLSDDPPDVKSQRELKAAVKAGHGFDYPEWDYRTRSYHRTGATVRLLSAHLGSQAWVDATLAEHQSMLELIRRRFEMLRAQRVLHRKLVDGDEIDLDAYITSYADFRAGSPMTEALYQSRRTSERSLAITLLIDISGSTDSWIASHRRIIDVEREALLLVCIALESMGEPYSVQAFSGEGHNAVAVWEIKSFAEHYSNDVALRISALEPQRYTRAGAALRHATAQLMHMPAAHRLLLLLSDGKPNDSDHYEGRYGVEDMRKAVSEAKLQGIFPFCLTIDRQAANYLPGIFGVHQYALLPKAEQLPRVLLEWMRRLLLS